ncbi:uncharacterized protein EMH_0025820 [Eimeria mitis]|uniref:RNA helicase n=1 Tax=Eimeria mitis TaxID=44415 RepID=U6KIY1_9EIME|nr:uncharacterized protein EMH_0025820 [Eimeria mitis]CDJ35398.1 hypothetical protein EMH_0025820 [Eimeria mitis]
MVGTPTGVLQYLDSLRQQQHRFDMQLFLEMLIVDEADLLFAFGFEKDTKRLLQLLPSTAAGHYQTILVSATQNQELSQLQNLMLHKPLIIRIEEEEGTPGGTGGANPIGEFYFQVPSEAEKWLVAYAFLRLGLVPLKCLVFCKDVSNVYALRLFLDRFGIASGVLSPTLPIAAREQQIQAFNQGLIDILITNDGQYMEEDNPQTEPDDPESAEASTKEAEFAGHRGLDLQGVACVFNFDAPNSLKSYIHRVEDVRRGITKRAIAAAVARDLQQQLLNSRKLKEFFERNPRDREVLKRACKQLKEMNVSKGTLGHLPDYLLSQTRPTQVYAGILLSFALCIIAASDDSHPTRDPTANSWNGSYERVSWSRSAPTGKRKAKRREIITRQSQLNKMPKHPDELAPECLPATSGRKLWKLRHNKRVGVKDPKGNFLRKRSTKGLRKK